MPFQSNQGHFLSHHCLMSIHYTEINNQWLMEFVNTEAIHVPCRHCTFPQDLGQVSCRASTVRLDLSPKALSSALFL